MRFKQVELVSGFTSFVVPWTTCKQYASPSNLKGAELRAVTG